MFYPLLPMDVYAGEKRIAGMQAASGKMAIAKAQVMVREGKLLLTFEPKTGDHWKLAALTIRST
ncbi:MAG TPA: hypothetical protein VHR86_10095, partial [Armatimonadota bacterium]|nr:hypothetical protein [Armatimonadota bacterium]